MLSINVKKSSLSSARRELVALMQGIGFGRIENLAIRSGEPVFDPPPRVIREVKFGSENGPRPERGAGDFALKAQVVELLRLMDELGDATFEVLEVKHGLPFRVLVAEPAR